MKNILSTTIELVSNSTLSVELSTGALLRTSATSVASGILSLGAVLLNTSSKTVSVLAARETLAGLKNRLSL